MNFLFKNYDEQKQKAINLMKINRDKFTLEKMAVKLDEITKPILDSISSQVKLNLPKLKKVNNSSTSTPSIKLPKLKNLSEKASV